MGHHGVPVQVKLSALWGSLMGLYIYNDYFKLYRPGVLPGIAAGHMGPLGHAGDGVLIAVSIVLALPALMIAVSVLLPHRASCWLNIPLALAYTAIEGLTMLGAYPAYQIVVAMEIGVTLTILVMAMGRAMRRG